jgi:hypothetical protein
VVVLLCLHLLGGWDPSSPASMTSSYLWGLMLLGL